MSRFTMYPVYNPHNYNEYNTVITKHDCGVMPTPPRQLWFTLSKLKRSEHNNSKISYKAEKKKYDDCMNRWSKKRMGGKKRTRKFRQTKKKEK